MNTDNLFYLLIGILLLLLIQALSVGRTARSKGRSFLAYALLAIVSPVIATTVIVLIRPANFVLEPGKPVRRAKVSSLALIGLGILVEVYGIGQLPLSETMTDSQIIQVLASQAGLGSLTIFASGILCLIGASVSAFARPSQ